MADEIEQMLAESARATRATHRQDRSRPEEILSVKLPRRSWWSQLVRARQYRRALRDASGYRKAVAWKPRLAYAAVVVGVALIALAVGYRLGGQQHPMGNTLVSAQLLPNQVLSITIDPALAQAAYSTIVLECKGNRPVNVQIPYGFAMNNSERRYFTTSTCPTGGQVAWNQDDR